MRWKSIVLGTFLIFFGFEFIVIFGGFGISETFSIILKILSITVMTIGLIVLLYSFRKPKKELTKRAKITLIILEVFLILVLIFVILIPLGVFDKSNRLSDSEKETMNKDLQEKMNELFEEDYNCESNIYNCGDFETQQKAQEVFELCGGIENDIHSLDRDGNGIACEGLK
jgi:amino acid transporter